MLNYLKTLENEVLAWSSITIHPHRFGGKEVLFGNAEVGHIHEGGIDQIMATTAVVSPLQFQRIDAR